MNNNKNSNHIVVSESVSNKAEEVNKYLQQIRKSNEKINTKINNIKMERLINKLKTENKKIPKVKEIIIEYQELIKQKDSQINNLIKKNEVLNNDIQKIPLLIRKIFIK